MELEDLIDDTEYEDGLPDIWCGTKESLVWELVLRNIINQLFF